MVDDAPGHSTWPLLLVAAISLSGSSQCSSRLEGLENTTSWVDSQEVVYFLGVGEKANWLYSSRLDRTNLRSLSSAAIREYVLSPDGNWIAAVHATTGCEIIDTASGNVSQLPLECDWVDWDPSGERILVTDRGGRISTYEKSTALVRDLAKTAPSMLVGPRWSRTGDRLFYCDLNQIACYQLELATGKIQHLGDFEDLRQFWHHTVGIENLHFNQFDQASTYTIRRISPTGLSFALVRDGSLWVADLDGGRLKLLLEDKTFWRSDFGPGGFSNPYWSADGRYILGNAEDRLIIVDTTSHRAGVLTSGRNPLLRLPGYHPSMPESVDVAYNWVIKDHGY
ncbi:MAG TPA: hypothetical protein VFG76_11335 [Candidatus Polarisedimenticolia bacterium]|nr:hypothetical protein [Candidatus Polarisedimenticolia bacterium]